MAYSEAQKNATLKYRDKKGIVRLALDMTPEERERYKEQATKKGMSLKAYIVSLLEKDREEYE